MAMRAAHPQRLPRTSFALLVTLFHARRIVAAKSSRRMGHWLDMDVKPCSIPEAQSVSCDGREPRRRPTGSSRDFSDVELVRLEHFHGLSVLSLRFPHGHRVKPPNEHRESNDRVIRSS
jgi:hypothetical protein